MHTPLLVPHRLASNVRTRLKTLKTFQLLGLYDQYPYFFLRVWSGQVLGLIRAIHTVSAINATMILLKCARQPVFHLFPSFFSTLYLLNASGEREYLQQV
jgi:hypothetical protein